MLHKVEAVKLAPEYNFVAHLHISNAPLTSYHIDVRARVERERQQAHGGELLDLPSPECFGRLFVTKSICLGELNMVSK